MNHKTRPSIEKRRRFLRLAKAAGLAAKLVAPLCGMTIPFVYKKWKEIRPSVSVRRAHYISPNDIYLIVELLILGFDLFQIARALGVRPKDIVQLIEEIKIERWWWVRCGICRQECITFDLKVRNCRKPSCVESARQIRSNERDYDSLSHSYNDPAGIEYA